MANLNFSTRTTSGSSANTQTTARAQDSIKPNLAMARKAFREDSVLDKVASEFSKSVRFRQPPRAEVLRRKQLADTANNLQRQAGAKGESFSGLQKVFSSQGNREGVQLVQEFRSACQNHAKMKRANRPSLVGPKLKELAENHGIFVNLAAKPPTCHAIDGEVPFSIDQKEHKMFLVDSLGAPAYTIEGVGVVNSVLLSSGNKPAGYKFLTLKAVVANEASSVMVRPPNGISLSKKHTMDSSPANSELLDRIARQEMTNLGEFTSGQAVELASEAVSVSVCPKYMGHVVFHALKDRHSDHLPGKPRGPERYRKGYDLANTMMDYYSRKGQNSQEITQLLRDFKRETIDLSTAISSLSSSRSRGNKQSVANQKVALARRWDQCVEDTAEQFCQLLSSDELAVMKGVMVNKAEQMIDATAMTGLIASNRR